MLLKCRINPLRWRNTLPESNEDLQQIQKESWGVDRKLVNLSGAQEPREEIVGDDAADVNEEKFKTELPAPKEGRPVHLSKNWGQKLVLPIFQRLDAKSSSTVNIEAKRRQRKGKEGSSNSHEKVVKEI